MSDIERFILNTGRSGSNMLTRMLAQNQQLLVLSDFFVCGDNLDRFPSGPVTGERFAAWLRSVNDIGTLLARREMGIKEQLYHAEEGARWTDRSRMPAMLAAPLPFLSDDPEALFDDIQEFALSRPTADFADQCRALFSWLQHRYGKSAWLERSGSNLRFVRDFRQTFPNARYLHLNRDGIEASMSAREHNFFKVAVEYDERLPSTEQLEQAIAHPTMDDTDAVTRLFGADQPPLECFGRHWMRQVCAGFQEFVHLDRNQYMEVRYEDILAQPAMELERIEAFFELPEDTGWIERAVATIDPTLGKRPVASLERDEYTRIAEAVLPGQILLGRASPYRLEKEVMPLLRDAFERFDR
jgi:Sulfotransferase family